MHKVSIEERTDHLGKVFKTKKDMCDHWNVERTVYNTRIKSGLTKKEALTIKNCLICSIEDRTDHLGKVFESKKDMCDHWGIPKSKYNDRIKLGWSKEKALTFKDNASISIIEDRTDHLGKVFESKKDMCDHWNISYGTYIGRIKAGWSKEKALTFKDDASISIIEDRTDHLGKVFKTKKDMYDHWGVEKTVYQKRIKAGWSKEKALNNNTKSVISDIEERTDHLGNVFESKKDMCDHWGLSNSNYNHRIKVGWSKEKALTIINRNNIIKFIIDNMEYKNYRDIEKDYNISCSTLKSRINKKYSPEEVVGIFPLINKNTSDTSIYNITIVKFSYDYNGLLYFKCIYNDKITILSRLDILQILRDERVKRNNYNIL